MTQEFFSEHYVDFFKENEKLAELAREYIERTDSFDNLICTGPVWKDGSKMPINSDERGQMTRNAIRVMEEMVGRANELGFGRKALLSEIRREEYFTWRKFNK